LKNAVLYDKSLVAEKAVNHFKDVDEEITRQADDLVFTWGGLSAYILHRIRELNHAVRDKLKEKYLPKTTAVLTSIHIMLMLSNTDKHDSAVLERNPKLRKINFAIQKLNSRLALATKLASTVWPPPEVNSRLLETTNELVQAITRYIQEASAAQIPIESNKPLEELNRLKAYASQIINSTFSLEQKVKSDPNIICKLSMYTRNIITIIDHLQDTLDTQETVYSFTNDLMQDAINLISTVGEFLLLVDELSFDSLFDDITIDFKVNRLILLKSITEFVTKFDLVFAGSVNHRTVCEKLYLLGKATKELLISSKFLIDELENLENDTLEDYIEHYSVPAPKNASNGLRKAASTSFKKYNFPDFDVTIKRPATMISPVADDSRAYSVQFSGLDSETTSSRADQLSIIEVNRNSYNATMFAKYQRFSRRESIVENEDLPYHGSDYIIGKNLIISNDNEVKGGTIEALVSYLTNHRFVDERFRQAFMLTLKSFVTCEELLGLLINRFNISDPDISGDGLALWKECKKRRIRLQVVSILKLWVERYTSCPDDPILLRIQDFVNSEMIKDMPVSGLAILNLIETAKSGLMKQHNLKLVEHVITPKPIIPNSLSKFKLLDLAPSELARQFTIFECKGLLNIHPTELLAKAWGLSNAPVKTVEFMIQISNQITNWVSRSILEATEPKKRIKIVGFFISLANVFSLINLVLCNLEQL
jgi:hypothetical protein